MSDRGTLNSRKKSTDISDPYVQLYVHVCSSRSIRTKISGLYKLDANKPRNLNAITLSLLV